MLYVLSLLELWLWFIWHPHNEVRETEDEILVGSDKLIGRRMLLMILCYNSVPLSRALRRYLWTLVLLKTYTIWMMTHFKLVDNTQTEECIKFEEKLKKHSEEMGCISVGVSAEEDDVNRQQYRCRTDNSEGSCLIEKGLVQSWLSSWTGINSVMWFQGGKRRVLWKVLKRHSFSSCIKKHILISYYPPGSKFLLQV